MKQRYTLFRRGQVFYCQDDQGRQTSLRTRDESEARSLLHSKNEAARQPGFNLQMAKVYLSATDPEFAGRTWQHVMDAMQKGKTGTTLTYHERSSKNKALNLIRHMPILETQAAHLLKVVASGGVAANVYLRRMHSFALGMNWIAWPILAKKLWPKAVFKEKRAVTWPEHQAIISAEQNTERRAYYECCWHLGGAQSDIAELTAENINWQHKLVSFHRKKTGTPSIIRFGNELEQVLRTLPTFGPLFPRIAALHEKHRATEFARRCKVLGISGITLHSYRYAWAERAKVCGYPERFAQEALGHRSHAVHRAYSKGAQVTLPALEDYEKKQADAGTPTHQATAVGA